MKSKKIIISITALFSFFIMNGCKTTSKMTFLDAAGKKHKFEVNQNVKSNPYDLSKFSKIDGKMIYSDENYSYKLGIDISRHDGIIDWEKVKASGIEFVIFRIGYRRYQAGTLHVDENFHENIKGAQKVGLDVGVYVFSQAITEEEAIEEADLAINELKDYSITLPVVFDPEHILNDEARTDNIPGEVFTQNAIIFCEKVKAAGYKPMVYANLMWQAYTLDLTKLSDYEMWYADYEEKPQTPYNFTFWQYEGENGIVPGIEKPCDMDIWIIKK